MMNIQNSVTLIGNLGRDFELKDLGNGRMLAKSSLATSEAYKNKAGERVQETTWHNVIVWGKQAQEIVDSTQKGSSLMVVGKIQYNKYEDRDGVTRYSTDIVVQDFHLLADRSNKIATL